MIPTYAAADAAAVTQVVLRERQCRDRGWWQQMVQTFWPDSRVRLSWYDGDGPGFVAGSEAMAARGRLTVHHMFAPVAHVRGDKAYVEASAAIRASIVVDDVRGDLVSYSRLNYRLERRDDEWRIRTLDAIYEYTTLTPAVPGERIEIPAAELSRFRSSYAILAWEIARHGGSDSDDLLGDDRPGPVAAFYGEMWEWLDS